MKAVGWLIVVSSVWGGTIPTLEPEVIEPPLVGRPLDFSGLVGVFRLAVKATPTAVAVEEPITVTVTISGRAVPPYVPRREALRLFPNDLERDFYVAATSEKSGDDVWEFVYLLRPKHGEVRTIPGLRLCYYAPRQRRYQTAYADAIAIQVRAPAPPESAPPLRVLAAPPWMLELAEEAPVRSYVPAPWTVVVFAVGVPLCCIGATWWACRKPRLDLERRRRRAAERTRSILTKSRDPSAVAAALVHFLRDGLDFPALEPTEAEVDRWLKRCGASVELRRRFCEVLKDCAALRFGPVAGEPVEPLIVRACLVLDEWEGGHAQAC
ncbi:MAG: hypothetical protein NZO58_05305 [Gemmataceae bacterium]|nr:hypothetical protein [Gemmataceae bacterium]